MQKARRYRRAFFISESGLEGVPQPAAELMRREAVAAELKVVADRKLRPVRDKHVHAGAEHAEVGTGACRGGREVSRQRLIDEARTHVALLVEEFVLPAGAQFRRHLAPNREHIVAETAAKARAERVGLVGA